MSFHVKRSVNIFHRKYAVVDKSIHPGFAPVELYPPTL